MPRSEKPLNPGPLAGFAGELRSLRRLSGLSYRQLSERSRYSHTVLVRAAGGEQLPTWDVTRAFVINCGVSSDEVLGQWRELWEKTALRHRQTRTTFAGRRADADARGVINDPAMVGRLSCTEWLREGRWPEDLSAHIDAVSTTQEFGAVLRRLCERAGCFSVRDVERESMRINGGHALLPRATIGDWFCGRRLPSTFRLQTFMKVIRSSNAEQLALLLCWERLRLESRLNPTIGDTAENFPTNRTAEPAAAESLAEPSEPSRRLPRLRGGRRRQ